MGAKVDSPDPIDFFHGSIYSVRIYDRALSADEVRALFDFERHPGARRTNTAAQAMLAAAAKMSPPTNNMVAITQGAGEVAVFDSNGIILKSNDNYSAKIALVNITAADCGALLETRTAYEALTSFRHLYGTTRTAGSEDLEWQLRDIWLKGASLPDKIQTRESVLDDMRGYNEALAAYRGNQKAEAGMCATVSSTHPAWATVE